MNIQKTLRIIGLVVVICIFLISGFSWIFGNKKNDETIQVNQVKEATTYSYLLNNGKPSFVMFYAPWCSYCEQFKTTYNKLEKQYNGRINFVMINGEDPANIAAVREFMIGSYPTIYIIDPKLDNRVLLNNTIYDDIEKIKVELDRYLRIRSTVKE